jgi:hypothetical protein
MKVKLTTHRKNLESNNMGHCITSKMVREHWLPLLKVMAKEDRLKTPNRVSPLWPQFEEFLETQSQSCRERERLGLATSESHPGGAKRHKCTGCKSKIHIQADCRAQFCLQHGPAGIILIKSEGTLRRKEKMEICIVTFVRNSTRLEVTRNPEQNQGKGTPTMF